MRISRPSFVRQSIIFRLGQLAALDDVADFRGELRLDQHLVGVGAAKIGIVICAARFDLDQGSIPFEWASAAPARIR